MQKCLRVALVLLAVGANPVAAADAVEALLRQRGEAFVSALNAQGDALTAFARDHLESRVARDGLASRFAESMRAAYDELGPVVRHSVQVLRSGTLVFVYCRHAKGGAWQNYQFRVIAEDGHRLQLVFRAVAVEPIERPGAALGTPQVDRWLQMFQTRLDEQQPFSGVAVVQRGGRDVYRLAQGVANAATKAAVTRATRFGMASGSKMFTAVAVLQLAQAGKVSLADPLIKYLPDFPNRTFAERATLHQLLTHTAGAGNYWDDAYEKAWGSITDLRQMLPFVLAHLGASPAGESSYSNSGFVLLGLVVEAVSGTSYYDYVRTHVFEPAGMTSTGFPLRGDASPDAALPYEPEMDAGAVKRGVYVPVTLGARGSSAGGASTTVDDLLRFAGALQRGVLLDKVHLELMTRGHAPYGGPDAWYGYGAIVDRSRGVVSYGHGGMARGTFFELRIYPERDTTMVVMSNYNTIAGPEIASALDHLVRNGDPPATPGAAAHATPARAASTSAPVPAGAPFAGIRAELEQLVRTGKMTSAAVGVIRQGQVEWAEAFGLADREQGIAATVDTPYGIASMGKAVTSTAVMTLVEGGRLRLDTRVDEVLGPHAVRVLAGDRAPTVRELLDMTAGIPHGAITYRVPDHPTEADVLRRQAIVVFPPGEVFHYSNFSIAVADAVVETASGRPFGEYLRERVFSPLQMTHSWLGDSSLPQAAARRYDAEGRAHVDTRFPRSSRQMQASLMDLLKFAAFQLGTQLPGQRPVLGARSIAAMQQQRSASAGAHMALGIGSMDIGDGKRWVISSGNDIGVQSHFTLLPHADLGVVVLLNDSGDTADELGIRIADAASSGFAEQAMSAIRAHQARTTKFTPSPAWLGEWAGAVVTAASSTPLRLTIGADGSVRAALGARPPVVVENTSSRDGTFTGSFTGRLPLDELPDDDHLVEVTLRRSGDTLAGFVLANVRTARGKFEVPVPVLLEQAQR